ncbi:DUF2515 family protein [Gracilibacillus phocaeensis]|uniref:DUF2515 family protein n=1 Tax=Gracilibacillus phocaeensis TaxID=2042304 RepID=UPI002570DD29|nr:DUF2515 family protein [Gracilibacillus phocaeensis]
MILSIPDEYRKLKQKLNNSNQQAFPKISHEDQHVIRLVVRKTKSANLNNLTRTKAYLDFYLDYPEINWSMLAHMVSRNAGWNMTDLRGSNYRQLLSEQQQHYFFNLLEKNNWLIFQDAYPQLLLYAEGLRHQKDLSYLLPYFGISIFMQVMWEYFHVHKDLFLLNTALIINEQHYIEKRVMQNKHWRPSLSEKIKSSLPELLQWNYILFPFHKEQQVTLVGLPVRHFASLKKRIILGKKLYQLLCYSTYTDGILEWAMQQKHSGSRSDYWPDKFSVDKPMHPYSTIYSPCLNEIWPNIQHTPALWHDWYHDWHVLHFFKKTRRSVNGKIQKDYVEALQQLEFANMLLHTLDPT